MSASGAFAASLERGRLGESLISCWLQQRYGVCVLPAYDVEEETGKGSRIFRSAGLLIAPDLIAYSPRRVFYIEAKHKTYFTWSNRHRAWQTGIDLRHYRDYLKVVECCPFPVWLLFLHSSSCPPRYWDSMPDHCPTGLFGGDIRRLQERISHFDTFERQGRRFPMVYWNYESLPLLASLDEVRLAHKAAQR